MSLSDTQLASLLAVAEAEMKAKVLPAIAPEARLTALMGLRAMAISHRTLATRPRMAALDATLAERVGTEPATAQEVAARAVRAGQFDGDERLHAILARQAALALSNIRPERLRPAERALLEDEGGTSGAV